MTLREALAIINQARSGSEMPLRVHLVCGFTSVHLNTFLAAHLISANGGRGADVLVSPAGDLLTGLTTFDVKTADVAAVVLQWPDLDPRLGLRRTGGWQIATMDDICSTVFDRLARISEAISNISRLTRVVVALPGLPLPPAFPTSGRQLSRFESRLRHMVAAFAMQCAELPMVAVLNEQWLNTSSHPSQRHDVRGDIALDSPMRPSYAAELGKGLAMLISPAPPLKGLITDLDDTLWRGIIGDTGVNNICWDLDTASHNHALYQQLLESLAATGVLLAVASKNEPNVVAAGLARSDLRVSADRFFPVVANWSPKSEMVKRILTTWNIGPNDVVFVDDNPMEVAEVHHTFPSMKCFLFPTSDYEQSMNLLVELRDLFGRTDITAEDLLRSNSLRQSAALAQANEVSQTDMETFIAEMEATVDLRFGADATDPRLLQLINKTNQFNMNGIRLSDTEWMQILSNPHAIVLVSSYTDKFGPLGKVSVAVGELDRDTVRLQHWALSCRAFQRRIEYRMLVALFERLQATRIDFSYVRTDRNTVFTTFLSEFADTEVSGVVGVSREAFYAACPKLYERCNVYGNGDNGSS